MFAAYGAILISLACSSFQADEMQSSEGRIGTISADEGMLILIDSQGLEQTFQFNEGTAVTVSGAAGRFSDLREGDEVTVNWRELEDVDPRIAESIVCRRE